MGVSEEIGSGDMVVDADFSATQAAEIFLSLVGAGTVKRVGFLVNDSLHFKALVKSIP